MRIILATGIYPPAIGGPATYVRALAEQLTKSGHTVTVVTYGQASEESGWRVISVPSSGFFYTRWKKYAEVLKKEGGDADVVLAFSSVSAGIPLMMAKLTKPKKILRLGGDFFWERYTDNGGMLTLKEWHQKAISWAWRVVMQKILKSFDAIVYSTEFQQKIHEEFYILPHHSVIHNPVPVSVHINHTPHSPFRLLFMGRFVGFKNIPALIDAVHTMNDVSLTIVGDGLEKAKLEARSSKHETVRFLNSVHGEEKNRVFDEHDLLILPSITEISPNVALEAASRGLPVLLTEETGLQNLPEYPIIRRKMRTAEQIASAIEEVCAQYPVTSDAKSNRGVDVVASEWIQLFQNLSR
jgi:glycosyltransferase involved in cell wall biosynthesis